MSEFNEVLEFNEILKKVSDPNWKPKWNCENGDCENWFYLKPHDNRDTKWCLECEMSCQDDDYEWRIKCLMDEESEKGECSRCGYETSAIPKGEDEWCGDCAMGRIKISEETCDKCGKSESECDQFAYGDNITNFAETGEMLCPDCIPETKLERESVSEDSDPRQNICGRRLPFGEICDEKPCDGYEYCSDCLERELGMN